MKKINLVYWNEPNFGDALSPQIIEELSVCKTKLKAAYINSFRKFIKGLLFLSWREIRMILFPWQPNILGVGSVITCGNSRSKVWGSGFMSDTDSFKGGDIFAVRGPLTAQRLIKQGFPKCEIYGDPALLLPLWIKPAIEKKYKLGIVPHWKEVDKYNECYGSEYKVIDSRTKKIEKILEEITSCEYILSASLHGLIVPHAYNIPDIWIKDGYIETDGFKFLDYFASVNIPEYGGFTNVKDILADESNWMRLFNNNKDKSLINEPIDPLQKRLIRVAPFPLKKKYETFVNM